MADRSAELQNEDGKTVGYFKLTEGTTSVTKNGRKVFFGSLKVTDEAHKEIATVAFLPDITLVKFADGQQQTLKSPYDNGSSVIFFDEGHFENIIASSFAFIIATEKDDRQKTMQELRITCASPLKHNRLAATTPITQQHDTSSAEQRIRKFPPDFSPN